MRSTLNDDQRKALREAVEHGYRYPISDEILAQLSMLAAGAPDVESGDEEREDVYDFWRGLFETHADDSVRAALADVVAEKQELQRKLSALEERALTEQPLRTFLKSWLEEPPLVRASVAAQLVLELERHIAAYQRAAPGLTVMPRRKRVNEHFIFAQISLRQLLVALANDADVEAVEAGVDAALTNASDV